METEIEHDGNLGVSGSVVKTLVAPYIGEKTTMSMLTISTQARTCLNTYTKKILGLVVPSERTEREFLSFQKKKTKKGECVSRHTDNMLPLRWHDKRGITMLTTIHEDLMIETGKTDHTTGENIIKPLSVVKYNENMGLVDKANMQISFTANVRKTLKWYVKVFFLHN
jgi:hypothetical protein